MPPGITFARVNPETGKSLPPGAAGGLMLPFRLGTVPEEQPFPKVGPGGRPGDDLL